MKNRKITPRSRDYTRKIFYATEELKDEATDETFYIRYEIEPNAETHRDRIIETIALRYDIKPENLLLIRRTTTGYSGTEYPPRARVTFIE